MVQKRWVALLSACFVEKGIGFKQHTADTQPNSLAVLDRVVLDVKGRFERTLARTGTGDEKLKLEKALKGHNNAMSGPIHGSPNDVAKNETLQFMSLLDNAQKIKHNTKVANQTNATATIDTRPKQANPLPHTHNTNETRQHQSSAP